MATDFGSDRLDAMTSAEARAALDALARDGAALAPRIVTPWWYHPTLGALVAVLVGAHTLGVEWSMGVTALVVVALAILPTAYARRYGVTITRPAGPRSRRLLLAVVAVLVAGMLSSFVVKHAELDPRWALIPAVATFAATVVLGRRYDDALRAELAHPGGAQA